jgi:hypothetical protein
LLEATLLLTQDDLRAVEGAFLFRNRELVEVVEAGEATDFAMDSPTAPAPAEHAPAAPPAANQVPPPPTAGDELRAIATLHRLGADLGEPIEVSRTGTAILVTGSGIPLPRRLEIENALRKLRRVEVHFTPPAAPPDLPTAGPRSLSVTPEPTAFQVALEKYLGGRTLFDRFTDEVLESADALVSRAHALRRLDERFPAAAILELNEAERDLLRSIRRNHAETLAYRAASLERQMRPALAAAGAEEAPEPLPGAISSLMLVNSAQRLERSIAVLLGGAAGEPVTPVEALSALAELRAASRVYLERITIEDRN